MFDNKKGLQSYVFVLLLVSFLMAIFLFIIINKIYPEDDDRCFQMQYSIDNQCRLSDKFKISINNFGSVYFELLVDGERNSYFVPVGEKTDITIVSSEDSIKIVPIIPFGETYSQCNSQAQTLKKEVLIKC